MAGQSDDSWKRLTEPSDRLRWARARAGYKDATAAATALAINPVTYRSYERPPEDHGRWPKRGPLQKIADQFRVDWAWLVDGKGTPFAPDPDAEVIRQKVVSLPESKRADAIRAVNAVLDSYHKRRG